MLADVKRGDEPEHRGQDHAERVLGPDGRGATHRVEAVLASRERRLAVLSGEGDAIL